MSAGDPSPYAVLGIARDAAPGAIKRAYFEKLRRFPPETHPEEFKAIRAAYETLSDPESRAAYDLHEAQLAEHPAPLAADLREANELLAGGNPEAARALLELLLADDPGLNSARELLVLALLSLGEEPAAIVQLERLIELEPGSAAHHHRLGELLHRHERFAEAAASFRRALTLDPADRSAHVALADSLAALGELDGALAELSAAMGSSPAGGLEDLGVRLRRIALHLRKKRWEDANPEIAELERRLPPDAPPELRRHVATQLGSIAARLFAAQRGYDANLLLTRCRRINPDSKVEVHYPVKLRMQLVDFPEASRRWIEAEPGVAGRVESVPWTGPVALLGASIVVAAIAVTVAFTASEQLNLGERFWLLAGLVASPPCIVWSRHWLQRVRTGRLGIKTLLHSLHMFETEGDGVTVWPLLHLDVVRLLGLQGSDGSRSTDVVLHFSDRQFHVPFPSEQAATDWAHEILRRRDRVRQLLGSGLLEGEEGIDFLPAAVLEDVVRRDRPLVVPGPSSSFLQYGLASALGLLVFIAAIPLQLARAEDRAWAQAFRSGTAGDLLPYLGPATPTGRRERAERLLAARHAAARAELAARLPEGAPAIVYLSQTLDALEGRRSRELFFLFTSELAPDPAAAPGAAPPSWPILELKRRRGGVLTAIQGELDRAGLRDVVRLEDLGAISPAAGPGLDAPALLSIRERMSIVPLVPGGGPRPDPAAGIGLRTSWEVTLRAAGAEPHLFRSEVILAGPTGEGAAALEATSVRLANAAAEELHRRWIAAWGLAAGQAGVAVVFPAADLPRSPYVLEAP